MWEVTQGIFTIKIRANLHLLISIDQITEPTGALIIPNMVSKVTESETQLHNHSFREEWICPIQLWCFLHHRRWTTMVSKNPMQTLKPTTKITWITLNHSKNTADHPATYSSRTSPSKCSFKMHTMITNQIIARFSKRINLIGKCYSNNNRRLRVCLKLLDPCSTRHSLRKSKSRKLTKNYLRKRSPKLDLSRSLRNWTSWESKSRSISDSSMNKPSSWICPSLNPKYRPKMITRKPERITSSGTCLRRIGRRNNLHSSLKRPRKLTD